MKAVHCPRLSTILSGGQTHKWALHPPNPEGLLHDTALGVEGGHRTSRDASLGRFARADVGCPLLDF
eukprot:6506740-Alexandrium_andersonii.AAC.1